jgi:hypothetical protein
MSGFGTEPIKAPIISRTSTGHPRKDIQWRFRRPDGTINPTYGKWMGAGYGAGAFVKPGEQFTSEQLEANS